MPLSDHGFLRIGLGSSTEYRLPHYYCYINTINTIQSSESIKMKDLIIINIRHGKAENGFVFYLPSGSGSSYQANECTRAR